MVHLDADQVFLIVLLVVLAVVVYLELRFMRSRNREHIQLLAEKDEAYNAIATTKAIASTLKQKGRDIKEAEPFITEAENAYHRNKFVIVIERSKRAREIMMSAPVVDVGPLEDAAEPQTETQEEEWKTVHEVKKLEPHFIESRFIINSCRDRLEVEEGSGKDLSEAKTILARAESSFEQTRFDEALREGLRVRRLLEEAPQTQKPPKEAVLVKVPKPETRCQKCSAAVTADVVFCRKCGSPIVSVRTCTYCGAELADDDVFCPKCGRRA